MQIKEMFKKSITRDIQGVVIAGQGEKTNIATELEEYVVTPELQRHFADFFSAYAKGINGETTKMGVWISGFFGSGKSHLLKILSYILDNEVVGGKRAIDYFIDDKKITDPMVLADMQLAANTPSDIIIFNIDAKSESDGKSNKDAIVNVFLKVFNNSLGFCGAIPYLADLERKLTEDGKYEQFKETYQRVTGHDWYEERHEFLSRQDGVVDTLIEMGYMSEKGGWGTAGTTDGTIKANQQTSFPGFYAAGHYNPGVPISGTLVGKKWYLAGWGEWVVYVGKNLAFSKLKYGMTPLYGVLLDESFIQVGGTRLTYITESFLVSTQTKSDGSTGIGHDIYFTSNIEGQSTMGEGLIRPFIKY